MRPDANWAVFFCLFDLKVVSLRTINEKEVNKSISNNEKTIIG